MINAEVHHNIFGPGVVKEIDEAGEKIKIAFVKNTLTFPYPGAFRGFLTTKDPELKKALESQGVTEIKEAQVNE